MSSPLLFAAVSGLLLGAASPAYASSDTATSTQAAFSAETSGVRLDADAGDKHACKGQNACKGQGGCKTDKHACKGQNACKGQGGCKTMTAPKDKNSCSGANGCGSK